MLIEWTSGHALRAAYAARSLSPVDVARALLARIDRLNPELHAYLSVDPEAVLAQARRAEAALFDDEPLAPLHGIPVSIKDTLETAGLRSTSGSLLRRNYVPSQDAVAVARLRSAGAIILGKTNTSEFTVSARTANRLGPETVNPWDLRRTAAGSSGGSGSALAAGLGPISIGTDAGGSIRFPAAFNGVFGLMPSYGLVPKHGCVEIDEFGSIFSTIGPMSRDVRDGALALQAMAGYDPRDPTSSRRSVPDYVAACDEGVQGLTIGWLPQPDDAHREPGVEEAVQSAYGTFSELGATLRPLDVDLVNPLPISQTLILAASVALRRLAESPADRALLTPYTAQVLSAPLPSADDEAQVWTLRRKLVDQVGAMFRDVDLVATPVTCFTAPLCPDDPFARYMEVEKYIRTPMIATVAGIGAVSLPCGFHDGRPIGLMLMAPRGQEARLFRASAAFERARPWTDAKPPLSGKPAGSG